jgi:tetratricopeptide (TPR) repeat protein
MRRFFNLFVVLTLTALSGAQVRVWQGTLILPTYEEGMPDPNPPFDQFIKNKLNYPYVLRDNLKSDRTNHEWRAIYLENEYLKCSVLPDIGGHLYTCVDKISGQSMFYANSAIKKAAVGYRGAWAAFGIEFNFPVSHNWVSMSPVDFAYHANTDGSASAIVGNVDRVYGMEWMVELLLRPKSTLLEERVTLSNRSDVRHRFYWWNNAGVRVSDDSQIVYPMRFAASHGFSDVVRWPVDTDGYDLSFIRNHVHGAVSLFSYGSRESFMGVWHPTTRTGTVHFADYEDLPAKKIWSWGVDAEGKDWRTALSDDDSAYIEIQAGLFRNQETYAFLEPRQSIHFSEYWMPTREIGPISRANLSGVLSLGRLGNVLNVGFNANREFPKATVSISNGKGSVFSEKVDLAPERAWTHHVSSIDSHATYTVEIRDAMGATLLRQTEGIYDWTPESEIHLGPQTAYQLPDTGERTFDDWMQLGKDLELTGKNLQALDAYGEALRRFPGSFAASKSAGRLTASLLRFEEAENFLEQVQARDTSDPEISYYLGIAYEGLGKTRKARSSYENAQRFASYRSAAALRLGEMLAREGDLNEAERHLSDAVRAAPDDARAFEEQVAGKIASGKLEEGKMLARQGIARFPLSYVLREELGEPNLKQLANDSIRVLNLAAQYMRLGLYQRALTVLSREYPSPPPDQVELGALAPGKHPMLAYFRGYCRERLGQSGASEYKIASVLSTSYVFPSSAEELTVLNDVVRANPQDATAHYLLGTLHFSRGLTDAALEQWGMARKLNPQIPVLNASIGLALLHEKHDADRALDAFRDGLRSDAANVTLYMGADQAFSLLSKPASERVQVLEKYPNLAAAPSSLIFELILNLAEAGDFKRAESLFHNRFFPREEGGTNVRQVWVEVVLQKILASAKAGRCVDAVAIAEHLGATVPDLPFTRDGLEPMLQSARTNYQLGMLYASCAKPEEAAKKFRMASGASAPDQMVWAFRAAQKLPGFDREQWRERLQAALSQAESRGENSSYTSWWDYTAGALADALGRQQEADQKFQKALLLPDRMLAYHLTRIARAEAAPPGM